VTFRPSDESLLVLPPSTSKSQEEAKEMGEKGPGEACGSLEKGRGMWSAVSA
jgi:hypothetical protein